MLEIMVGFILGSIVGVWAANQSILHLLNKQKAIRDKEKARN